MTKQRSSQMTYSVLSHFVFLTPSNEIHSVDIGVKSPRGLTWDVVFVETKNYEAV